MPTGRRRLPPLNALRAFEAAARHGSFRDAAAELGVTHGAISRHVRLMEDWLGPPGLFRRLNRRVVLTPTGAALLADTGAALDRLAAAAERHRARRGAPAPAVLRVNALVTPFPDVSLPSRAYHAYRPESQAGDPVAEAFCTWLEERGEMAARP